MLIGGRPISSSYWSNTGIHYVKDLFNEAALCSFQELKHSFNLPGSSFFFYLQIRSALRAHGVPWQQPLPVHPLYRRITVQSKTKGLVTSLYKFILEFSNAELPLDSVWRLDCPNLDTKFEWEDVWVNIKEASRNPNHQLIHFNFIHRTYLTPRKLHVMGLRDSPLCSLCTQNVPGTI